MVGVKNSSIVGLAVIAAVVASRAALAQTEFTEIITRGSDWEYLFTASDDGFGQLMPTDPFTATNIDFARWAELDFDTEAIL